MITVCILINGRPIMARCAVNIGPGVDPNERVYAVDDGSKVCHNPQEGAIALAKRLLDTIKQPHSGFNVQQMEQGGPTTNAPKPDPELMKLARQSVYRGARQPLRLHTETIDQNDSHGSEQTTEQADAPDAS